MSTTARGRLFDLVNPDACATADSGVLRMSQANMSDGHHKLAIQRFVASA